MRDIIIVNSENNWVCVRRVCARVHPGRKTCVHRRS